MIETRLSIQIYFRGFLERRVMLLFNRMEYSCYPQIFQKLEQKYAGFNSFHLCPSISRNRFIENVIGDLYEETVKCSSIVYERQEDADRQI